MKIDITLTSNLSYFFCGSISLKRYNNQENPLTVDLSKLSKQEVVGLVRSVKTGVISVVSGQEYYNIVAESLNKKKAEVKEVVAVEDEPKVEVETKTNIEETVVEDSEEKLEEEVKPEQVEKKNIKPATPRATPRKRVTTTK